MLRVVFLCRMFQTHKTFLSSRDQMNKMRNEISPLTRTPGLDSELDRLQDLLDRLAVEYKAKQEAAGKTPLHNNTGGTANVHHAIGGCTVEARLLLRSELHQNIQSKRLRRGAGSTNFCWRSINYLPTYLSI